MLASEARFVPDSCPQAFGIVLVREFKDRYEREFGWEKAQSARGERNIPQQRVQHAGEKQRGLVVQNQQMLFEIEHVKQQQAQSEALQRQCANAKMQCSTSGTVPGRAAVGSKAF